MRAAAIMAIIRDDSVVPNPTALARSTLQSTCEKIHRSKTKQKTDAHKFQTWTWYTHHGHLLRISELKRLRIVGRFQRKDRRSGSGDSSVVSK